MKIDSGASGTYLRKEDEHCLLNLQPTVGPTVTLPDHTKIHSNTSGDLPLPTLSLVPKPMFSPNYAVPPYSQLANCVMTIVK